MKDRTQLLVCGLIAICVTALAAAGALGWRALDAIATGTPETATAAVGLVGLFTSIAVGASGALAGALHIGTPTPAAQAPPSKVDTLDLTAPPPPEPGVE